MREILFKAKRIDNGEWVEGGFCHSSDEKTYIIGISKRGYIDGLEVVSETICQYTGLTDKNGNKIWENDVVKWNDKLYKVVFYESICSFVLVTSTGHWLHMEMDYGDKLECYAYKVIGNIFDNPELLSM